ncbi:MAG: FAD-binding protein, partial [Limnochordia bacterium]
MTERRKADFLVIGSGVAGLYTAVRAAVHGSTVLVTKGCLLDSNTLYAQGGIAAAIDESDSPQAHLRDTIQAGAGLCLEEAVAVLVSE